MTDEFICFCCRRHAADSGLGWGARTELTFMCKSSRGLESQNPVLAMVAAGGRVLCPGRCSYLPTGVCGGLERREEPCCPPPRTDANKPSWASAADWSGPDPRQRWAASNFRSTAFNWISAQSRSMKLLLLKLFPFVKKGHELGITT